MSPEITPYPTRLTRAAALVLSGITLGFVFWGLLQLDLPLMRFVRAIQQPWVDQQPWIDRAGDLGHSLGSGEVLFGISGAMLAVGLIWAWPAWRRAGLEGLIAHVAVGLIVQLMKHLVGRPRPRFTHGDDEFQFGPSLASGLDTFPSGHAAASFAVAAVLAKHFPRTRWLVYTAAVVVALSRVLPGRVAPSGVVPGAHFSTDVAVGATLGLLVGAVVANPIREWPISLRTTVLALTPYLLGLFALLWVLVHPLPDQQLALVMWSAGILAMVIGVGARMFRNVFPARASREEWLPSLTLAHALIGIGLALTTASWLVTGLAALVCVAYWLTSAPESPHPGPTTQGIWPAPKTLLRETALAVALIIAVGVIEGLKGAVPLL